MKPLVASALFLAAVFAAAQSDGQSDRSAGIKPGEAVPPLKVAEWVKGDPIVDLPKGKVYLIEFWAVWCGPCIGNIPHLTELQKKYGKDGLVVIGMTNPDLETGYKGARKENNSLEQVRAFVAKQGDRMGYRVAYDTPEKTTFKALMGGIGGIPHAFLIGRDGKLLVDYHPFFMDGAIEAALAGTWDQERSMAQLRRCQDLYGSLFRAKDYPAFQAAFAELERDYGAMTKRTQNLRFDRALKAIDLASARDAAAKMIEGARATGAGGDLAGCAFTASRALGAILRGPFSGYVPAADATELSAMLREMSAVAAEVASDDFRGFAAQAEVAFRSGELAPAVDRQKQAVELAPAYVRPDEEKRLHEYEEALMIDGARRERSRAPGSS